MLMSAGGQMRARPSEHTLRWLLDELDATGRHRRDARRLHLGDAPRPSTRSAPNSTMLELRSGTAHVIVNKIMMRVGGNRRQLIWRIRNDRDRRKW
jgi:hypothetical protein